MYTDIFIVNIRGPTLHELQKSTQSRIR
jgi:hypothetical protein